jgi:predicted O-methyltransferase YrrM
METGGIVDIVHPAVERYMKNLASVDDEPVLLEMEQRAEENGFPIIGRLCGRTLEVLARTLGARRIFEMGSGFGYSAYWFSRATGPDGEIHLTDMDPQNERLALDYLKRAGLDEPINYHVSDALDALAATDGEFDIVYCDIDKGGYPRAWDEGRQRVRVGGLYISDNMLWSGRVTDERVEAGAGGNQWTAAIDETNRAMEADPDWRSTIVPTRDGVAVAVRIR